MTDERKEELQSMAEDFANEVEAMPVAELEYLKSLFEKKAAKNKKAVASVVIDLAI